MILIVLAGLYCLIGCHEMAVLLSLPTCRRMHPVDAFCNTFMRGALWPVAKFQLYHAMWRERRQERRP